MLPQKIQSGSVHKTIAAEEGNLPIDIILYGIDEILLRPNNRSLYVALKSSHLYPRLPSYFDAES
jgi:hypothetical protein